jgi:uncharacterized protein YjdB
MDRTIGGRGKRNVLISLSAVGLLLSSVSCDAGAFLVDPITLPDEPAFSLSPSGMTLGVGDSATISPTLAKANGSPVNPQSLKWESAHASVATVTRDGVVTGVAPGNTIIVASSGRLADTTWVTVVEHAARPGVRISPDTVALKWLNATATMTAEVRDADGTLVAEPGLTWRSLNPEIATADNMGVITAKGVGVALIVATAACCDQADTAYTRVYQAVDSVAVEPESVSLSPGSSVQLQAAALDRGGSLVEDATFEFRSADESVAKVSSDGLLTSQSSGTTTATAISESHSDDVAVTVSGTSGGTSASRPNEPAGYTPWFEHDWQTWDQTQRFFASGAGMVEAIHSPGPFELVDDPTAPHGKGKSLRHRQPEGQEAGTTGGVFNIFHPQPGNGQSKNFGDQVQLRSVYRSHWVFFEPAPVTGDWQFGDSHMRTFWWNRYYGLGHGNVGLRSPESPRPPNRYAYFRGASMWHSSPSVIRYSDEIRLAVGEWHQFEYLWETDGEFGVENGIRSRVRVWINGMLRADVSFDHYIERPFANEHFAMVWSGGGGADNPNTRTQDDFVRFGDIYVSGIPFTN